MIAKVSYGRILAGLVLILSGALGLLIQYLPRYISQPRFPINLALILLPLLAIQLLQGAIRPLLGWLGIGLIAAPILEAQFFPLPRGFDPFTAMPLLVVFLALYVLPLVVGFILLGISMLRTSYFPRPSGYLVALTPLTIPLAGLLPLAVVLIALGVREIARKPNKSQVVT